MSINYKLALKLKKVGFPQPDGMVAYLGKGYYRGEGEIGRKENAVFMPFLSELIEACGDKFAELSKGQPPIDHKWTATGLPINIFANGETPEESVAKLWILLNKK